MKDIRINNERYSKRLAVIVPYRNREEHLRQFLPHMLTYFSRDKLDRYIDYKILIVEQLGKSDFNRGKLLNAGFQLARNESDYCCFHDVDYLPIWADYSYSERPTRLIWHGLVLREDYDKFFGAVVMFDNRIFEKLNGFPNSYWGWGPEDLELGYRCELGHHKFDKRDGTFWSLRHSHNGFVQPGVHTEVAKRNIDIFKQRKDDLVSYQKTDGLNSLTFKMINKLDVVLGSNKLSNVFHYKVDIG